LKLIQRNGQGHPISQIDEFFFGTRWLVSHSQGSF
jgi:hypothetical protein